MRVEDHWSVEAQSFGQSLLGLVQPRVLLRPSDFQSICYYTRTWHFYLGLMKGENFRDGILGPNTGFSSDLLSNPVNSHFY